METITINETSIEAGKTYESNAIKKIAIAIRKKQTQGESCDWDRFDPDEN